MCIYSTRLYIVSGTAFVVSSELLPREDVAETRRFDVPDFSPGFVVDGVISTAEPRRRLRSDLCP